MCFVVRLVFVPWNTSSIAPLCDVSQRWLCLYGCRPLQLFVCMWSTPQWQRVRCLKVRRRPREPPLGAILFHVVWWVVSFFETECFCVFLGWRSMYLEGFLTPCFSWIYSCAKKWWNVTVLEGCGFVCFHFSCNKLVDITF